MVSAATGGVNSRCRTSQATNCLTQPAATPAQQAGSNRPAGRGSMGCNIRAYTTRFPRGAGFSHVRHRGSGGGLFGFEGVDEGGGAAGCVEEGHDAVGPVGSLLVQVVRQIPGFARWQRTQIDLVLFLAVTRRDLDQPLVGPAGRE